MIYMQSNKTKDPIVWTVTIMHSIWITHTQLCGAFRNCIKSFNAVYTLVGWVRELVHIIRIRAGWSTFHNLGPACGAHPVNVGPKASNLN